MWLSTTGIWRNHIYWQEKSRRRRGVFAHLTRICYASGLKIRPFLVHCFCLSSDASSSLPFILKQVNWHICHLKCGADVALTLQWPRMNRRLQSIFPLMKPKNHRFILWKIMFYCLSITNHISVPFTNNLHLIFQHLKRKHKSASWECFTGP